MRGRDILLRGFAQPVASAPGVSLPVTDDLVFWLKKGTANSSLWPDANGGVRPMTLYGSPAADATKVSFNGTSQYGIIAGFSGMSSAFSIYAKIRQVSWTASRRLFGGGAVNVAQAGASPNVAFYDTDATPYASNSNAALGTFVTLTVIQGSGAVIVNIDGNEQSDSSALDSLPSFTLAGNASGGFLANIDVVEVVAYNVAHTPAKQTLMKAYVAAL